MTISYPLDFPSDVYPKSVRFTSIDAVAVSRSSYNYKRQVQDFGGDSWAAEVSFPPLSREEAEKLTCFLLKLRGSKGTFYLYDPLGKEPRGSVSGTPLIKGANQTGYELITDGWSTSVEGVLLEGDYIQLGQRLYKVTSDVTSNSSGEATLNIWPSLRESPADNETLITTNCRGIFYLPQNINNIWSADESRLYDVTFNAIEAR